MHRVTTGVGQAAKEEQMYAQRMARQALMLWLLVTLVLFALSACGGGEKEAKPRPLPEEQKALRPGEYRSEEFEPALSFRVGDGWTNAPPETSSLLHIQWQDTGGIGFLRFQEVYEPTRMGTPNVVEAPEDMLGWFRQHPYLKSTQSEPVTVGGVEGERFDLSFGNPPQGYSGVCGYDCVDIGRVDQGGPPLAIHRGEKARVIILEDVEGETVTIASNSPASEFDRFAPEAQKVIDTVEWRSE
jgi:hypothetical protein